MTSTNQTENYGLPQWESSDPFRREDFNEAFHAIDAAVKSAADSAAAAPHFACGSYVGTNQCGSANPCSLTFDFAPKLFFVIPQNNSYSAVFILAAHGAARLRIKFYNVDTQDDYVNLSWNGNTVSWWATNAEAQMNRNTKTYSYVAIG